MFLITTLLSSADENTTALFLFLFGVIAGGLSGFLLKEYSVEYKANKIARKFISAHGKFFLLYNETYQTSRIIKVSSDVFERMREGDEFGQN